MTARYALPLSQRWQWCAEHRKRAWASEADAEFVRGQLADSDRMDVYPCEHRAGRFHVGHTPGISGDRAREAS